MKKALYTKLSGVLHVRNYDIQSSQAYIVRSFLEDAGLDTSWLDLYLRSGKETYALRAGLPVDVWKEAFYSIVMGAELPSDLSHSRPTSSLRSVFYDEFLASGKSRDRLSSIIGDTWALNDHSAEDKAQEAYLRFRSEILPLHKELDKWRKTLKRQWIEKGELNRGGKSLPNAVGVRFNWIREVEEEGSEKRALGNLSAFVLQGKEAAFIHRLTALLPEHGVLPISNEHDGLVTLGAIPDRVIEQVRQETDMPYVNLTEKEFA